MFFRLSSKSKSLGLSRLCVEKSLIVAVRRPFSCTFSSQEFESLWSCWSVCFQSVESAYAVVLVLISCV